jgi:hypothetical protein
LGRGDGSLAEATEKEILRLEPVEAWATIPPGQISHPCWPSPFAHAPQTVLDGAGGRRASRPPICQRRLMASKGSWHFPPPTLASGGPRATSRPWLKCSAWPPSLPGSSASPASPARAQTVGLSGSPGSARLAPDRPLAPPQPRRRHSHLPGRDSAANSPRASLPPHPLLSAVSCSWRDRAGPQAREEDARAASPSKHFAVARRGPPR